jgi:GTP-binding protein
MMMQAAKGPSGLGKVGISDVHFVMGAPDALGLPRADRAEVAFLGRSNVGKSSLLNHLINRKKLARVSNTPGRTRMLNVFAVDLVRGVTRKPMHLVDLPGYGYAALSHAEKEKLSRVLQGYVEAQRGPRCACLLLDIRRDPSDDDVAMLGWLRAQHIPTALVLTKTDKLGKSQRKPAAGKIANAMGVDLSDVLLTSSEEHLGREELWQLVWSLVERG